MVGQPSRHAYPLRLRRQPRSHVRRPRSLMRVLVDTNILLRSAQPNHPHCSQATHAVSKLLRDEAAVFFCPQNIAEFWNVATRPAEVNGLGFSHHEVLQEIGNIESLL